MDLTRNNDSDETVIPIIASHEYPRFSQYIAALEDDFVWDPDVGLLYYGGPREKAEAVIKPHSEKLISQVKSSVSKDDMEIFSNENLWDLDAFELGEIVKIQEQYYNLQALYTYFNKQFSDYDPFYYEEEPLDSSSYFRYLSPEDIMTMDLDSEVNSFTLLSSGVNQPTPIDTKKTTIELPGNREPFNLKDLHQIAKSSEDWWLPTSLKEFQIKWHAPPQQKSRFPPFRMPPCLPLIDSESDTESDQYPIYEFWYDDSDEESIDSESREIDYPYKDPDASEASDIRSDHGNYDYYSDSEYDSDHQSFYL